MKTRCTHRMVRINKLLLWSVEINTTIELNTLQYLGMVWVRKHHIPWESSLRNPNMGVLLEFTTYQDVESVNIDSSVARRLYRKLAA
jgi:hypothetical protein